MLNYIRKLRRNRRVHKPVITVEIEKAALLENLKAMQDLAPDWLVAPVLKSNAYGHGLTLVAEILKNENIPFFCVDSYPEAEMIRAAGVKTPLLIMGHTPNATIEGNKLKNISFVIFSLEQVRSLKGATVHLKFDTGMHRQGIMFSDLDRVFELLKENRGLKIEGAMTHFAESENPDSELTKKQLERWNEIVARFQLAFPVKYYHCANSGGFGFASQIHANVGRSGIAIYGINPGNLRIKLRPVLKMKSIISGIREIEAGEQVGYGGTFTAGRKSKIATVPVGYYEGLNRKLSGKGEFMIAGAGGPAPVVGRVSMNISSCDVTDLRVEPGAAVTVIDSVEEIARLCETIPYEVLVNIPPHLRRVVT